MITYYMIGYLKGMTDKQWGRDCTTGEEYIYGCSSKNWGEYYRGYIDYTDEYGI